MGKFAGILGFAWLAAGCVSPISPEKRHGRNSLESRPSLEWVHSVVVVAGLAFTEPVATAEAKVGILVASAVAGIAGMALLKFVCKAPRETAA